jgi:hypothetical protein
LKEIFGNANHLGRVKAGLEHSPNILTAMDRAFGYLMVDRIRMIQGDQRTNIRAIERINPSQHNFPRGHRSYPKNRKFRTDTLPRRFEQNAKTGLNESRSKVS